MFTVCVFCGTATGHDPRYAESAREVALLLAQMGCRIVFGAGRVGLMGVVAETALAAGGNVVGIATKMSLEKENIHHGLSALHVVETLHERKAMMMKLADAFLVLPGGYGTLDELFEVLALRQWNFHDNPCGLLNVDGFFDALLSYLDHVSEQGFLLPENRSKLVVDADPRALLVRIGVV